MKPSRSPDDFPDVLSTYRRDAIPIIESALRCLDAVPAAARQAVSDSIDQLCLSLISLDEEVRTAFGGNAGGGTNGGND